MPKVASFVKSLPFGKKEVYHKNMKKTVDVTCRAFQTAIEVLGRPWTAAIIGLLQGGPLRYSEIAERLTGVGDKTLSARLKQLEKQSILVRHVDGGPPVRVTYALTERGEAFHKVAEAIERWGRELVQAVPSNQAKRRS